MLPLHGQDTAAVEKSPGRMDLLYIQQAVFLLNRLNKGLPSSFYGVNNWGYDLLVVRGWSIWLKEY